jgi:hypothetical protein
MTDALIIQDNFAHAPPARGPRATRVFKNRSLGNRGRRECRVFFAPAALCAKVESTQVVTTGTPNIPAFPARWFYGLLRDLPGDRALLSPSPRNAKHCRKLTPASRRQDHTTWPSTTRALVSRACCVHRTPHPTFVTTAKRPSYRARGGQISGCDLPDGASKRPAARWHDGQIT